jgi:uncharacterized protein (DUF2141 family)
MKLLLLILTLFAFTGMSKEENTLQLTVNKIKNNEGVVRVLLFKGSEGFPDELDKAHSNASIKIQNGKAIITFEGLAEGDYALSVFHDSQNTGKLRTNAFGVPRDGYGFSNNATGTFGPPSFDKASFKVTAGKNHVEIDLR